jgi:hypothetical protein
MPLGIAHDTIQQRLSRENSFPDVIGKQPFHRIINVCVRLVDVTNHGGYRVLLSITIRESYFVQILIPLLLGEGVARALRKVPFIRHPVNAIGKAFKSENRAVTGKGLE